MNNQIKVVKTEIEQVNLILNIDNIVQLLEDIEEQISFARSNIINKNILSSNETEYIWQTLKDQKIFLNFKEEISQYVSCIVTAIGKKIFLVVKIPIVERKDYDLLRIETLNVNNTRVETDVKFVAKHKNTIFNVNEECTICNNPQPLNDKCISNIIRNHPSKCTTTTSSEHTIIREMKPGVILIDTTLGVPVIDSCSNSQIIAVPTLIETGNCTVKILNSTFTAHIDVLDQEDYFIPLTGSKTEITLNKPSIQDLHTMHISNIHQLHTITLRLRTHTIAGGILIVVLTGFLITAFCIYKHKTKHAEKKMSTEAIHNIIPLQTSVSRSRTLDV
uniref:uncharacterized protein LOC125906921 n=1 Tax=Anopheles coluzzii TaxID=1518534 RepID=UPI0020FF986D|nr:uncharacterized protein LOC125906921 [Anopheles coluzzii]